MTPLRQTWSGVAPDPTDEQLGYEYINWQQLTTEDGRTLYIPPEPEQLRDEAFVILDGDTDPIRLSNRR